MNWPVYLQQLQWREPLCLYLVLLPLLLYLLLKFWRAERITAYADKALIPWIMQTDADGILRRILSRNTFYSLSWILFSITAAGPRIVQEIPGEPPRQPVDIFIVVDVSQSMHTRDVVPNRIKRAKNEILQLIHLLHKERIGIIVYSARPQLFAPLTYDYRVLTYYVQQLDKLILPTAGSRVAEALSMSLRELGYTPNQGAIVLVTDGDFQNDRQEQLQQQAIIAQQIKQAGIHFSVLGIATVEGDAVPIKGGGWLQHDGKPVVSRMQEESLQQLAELGGGVYSEVQEDDSEWGILYNKNILSHSRYTSEHPIDQQPIDQQKVIWLELYQWPLLPAIVLFFIAVVPYRWTFKTVRPMSILIAFTVGGVVFSAQDAIASDEDLIKKAYQSYAEQNYQAALEYYSQITGYSGRIGEGASRYAAQQYSDAIVQFGLAALEANNDQQIATALYNLANSYFHTGNYAAAVEIYQDSLIYRANHQATLHNLELSKSLKKIVERRSRLIKSTGRAGRGPQQAIARQSLLLNESDSVSLDQSEGTGDEQNKNPLLANMPDSALALLIDKGIQNVQLVITQTGDPIEVVWKQDISSAKVKMADFVDDSTQLWQRIFEIKEGIEAPLDEPLIIPGVAPW